MGISSIDQEARVSGIQQVRIFGQRLDDTSYRRQSLQRRLSRNNSSLPENPA
ncbi:MAG TPA: hypothetical protein VGL34_01715 [Steroidobacteraceae bacterium]|jgi:hypothetical protein